MLDLLTALVEKSLVIYEERGGEGRYRLLETVRQYARGRLVEAGEGERLRSDHQNFFLHLAERAASTWFAAEEGAWLDRLQGELDNLRRGPCRALAPEATAAG